MISRRRFSLLILPFLLCILMISSFYETSLVAFYVRKSFASVRFYGDEGGDLASPFPSFARAFCSSLNKFWVRRLFSLDFNRKSINEESDLRVATVSKRKLARATFSRHIKKKQPIVKELIVDGLARERLIARYHHHLCFTNQSRASGEKKNSTSKAKVSLGTWMNGTLKLH